MSIRDRYQAYADAFEESFADDDWSHIEPYFTEDAVYRADGPDVEGRSAVLARLKTGVDAFDRRMDSRTLSFEEPRVEGNRLTVAWSARYTKAGAPDLLISGTETAEFSGDRIQVLAGEFDPTAQKAMGEWMAAHGAKLQ